MNSRLQIHQQKRRSGGLLLENAEKLSLCKHKPAKLTKKTQSKYTKSKNLKSRTDLIVTKQI